MDGNGELMIDAFVKIQKKMFFFGGGGGVVSGWVGGRGGVWSGGQGGCEQRSEVFVKIKKKN